MDEAAGADSNRFHNDLTELMGDRSDVYKKLDLILDNIEGSRGGLHAMDTDAFNLLISELGGKLKIASTDNAGRAIAYALLLALKGRRLTPVK